MKLAAPTDRARAVALEFGVALGLGKRVIVVGERENLFHRLEAVEVVPSWDDAFKTVAF